MMYWGHGFGGWNMAVMAVSSVLFWSLVIAGVVVLVRYLGRVGQPGAPMDRRATPEQVLADRFAGGEIDDDEYVRRLHLLRGTHSPGAAR
jgi:putative membrane protein